MSEKVGHPAPSRSRPRMSRPLVDFTPSQRHYFGPPPLDLSSKTPNPDSTMGFEEPFVTWTWTGSVLNHDRSEVRVAVVDPRLRVPDQLDMYPYAAEKGGLVVAVDAEDGDVDDSVVVAGEVDAHAEEGLLGGVSVDGLVLSEEGGGDEGLVAALDEDALGGEVNEVAVGDPDPGGVYDGDTAAPIAGFEEDVSKCDVLEDV
ncbi:hypothetical protein Dimus_036173 [Dionaea muscipula]